MLVSVFVAEKRWTRKLCLLNEKYQVLNKHDMGGASHLIRDLGFGIQLLIGITELADLPIHHSTCVVAVCYVNLVLRRTGGHFV